MKNLRCAVSPDVTDNPQPHSRGMRLTDFHKTVETGVDPCL